MLEQPKIAIAAIIATTVVILSFVGAITWLAVTGHSSETLLVAVVLPVVGLLVAVLRKMAKLEEKTAQIQHQTNGNTSRLLDAVLPTPDQGGK